MSHWRASLIDRHTCTTSIPVIVSRKARNPCAIALLTIVSATITRGERSEIGLRSTMVRVSGIVNGMCEVAGRARSGANEGSNRVCGAMPCGARSTSRAVITPAALTETIRQSSSTSNDNSLTPFVIPETARPLPATTKNLYDAGMLALTLRAITSLTSGRENEPDGRSELTLDMSCIAQTDRERVITYMLVRRSSYQTPSRSMPYGRAAWSAAYNRAGVATRMMMTARTMTAVPRRRPLLLLVLAALSLVPALVASQGARRDGHRGLEGVWNS